MTAMIPPNMLNLQIVTLGGNTLTLVVPCRSTVASVKSRIERSSAIPVREQHLLSGDRELRNSDLLDDCLSGSTLTLFRRPRPAEEAAWLEKLNTAWIKRDILKEVPAELQDDAEFNLTVIRRYPYLFECLSETMRDDAEVALAAVHTWAFGIFHYVSDRLKGDREFFREVAIQVDDPRFDKYSYIAVGCGLMDVSTLWVWRDLSCELRHDKDIVIKLLKYDLDFFYLAPDVLQVDPDVVLAAQDRLLSHLISVRQQDQGPCTGSTLNSFLPDHGTIGHILRARGEQDHQGESQTFYNEKGFILRALKTDSYPRSLVQVFLQWPIVDELVRWELQEEPEVPFYWLKQGVASDTMLAEKARIPLVEKARLSSADKAEDMLHNASFDWKLEQGLRRARSRYCFRRDWDSHINKMKQKSCKRVQRRGGRHKTSFVEDWVL